MKTVGCILETITGTLQKGEPVTLIGFGTFKASKRTARTGRNPRTGKPLKIKAKKVAKFTAGKKLKDAVAKKINLKIGPSNPLKIGVSFFFSILRWC